MGIAKKGKRKIVINDREFYWYVSEDEDSLRLGVLNTLTIVSEDKKFLVKYPICQKGEYNLLIVLGEEFVDNGSWGKTWQRVECPKWENSESITPGIVRTIVEWSLSKKVIKLIDYKGNEIIG